MRSRLIGLILFLSVSYSVCADSPAEALKMEKNGNIQQALKLYGLWLDNNHYDKDYSAVLLHVSFLLDSVTDSLDFLERYVRYCPESSVYKVYGTMGDLYNMSGSGGKACRNYLAAYENAHDNINDKNIFLFDVSVIKLQTGNLEEASEYSEKIFNSTTAEKEIRERAIAVFALCKGGKTNPEITVGIITEYLKTFSGGSNTTIPDLTLLYVLFKASDNAGDSENLRNAQEMIYKYYPESAVYYLINNKIAVWASPMDFLSGLSLDN